jgi:hypothetical protein
MRSTCSHGVLKDGFNVGWYRMVKKLKLPKDRQFVELRSKLAEAPENVR